MVTRVCFFVLIIHVFCSVSQCQLLNDSFEIPDPNRATAWFMPPRHWEWSNTPNNLNYVGQHKRYVPQPEEGQAVAWSIPEPVEGTYFVLLSTGDAEGLRSSFKTEYSSIEQPISVCPGDMLSGYYFFGTCDYMPYNDTGTVKLTPIDPNDGLRPIVLVSESVASLGNYQSTDGWQYFRIQFNADSCGDYILHCEVRDYMDRVFKSYLALDNFRICRGIPSRADLNLDCLTDYHDFDILSQGWLADCSDPNVLSDPNIPCHILIPDPNIPDKVIQIDSLLPLSEHWLEQYDR